MNETAVNSRIVIVTGGAAGIGRATLPTMAGLVVALPGLYFTAQLEHSVRGHVARMADRLQPQGVR